MKHFTRIAAAAAALSFSAGMASAVTVSNIDTDPTDGPQVIFAGQNVASTGGVITSEAGSFQYDYQVAEDLFIREFSLSVNGFNGGADINSLLGSFANGYPQSVELFAVPNEGEGRVTFGGGILNGMSFMNGDTFSVLFSVEDGQSLESDVVPTVTFETSDVAPVPVPAAGGLLLTALMAGGFVARRKKKAD